MNINKYLIIFKLLLFSCCLCEISEGEKEKLLNGFLDHYNSLPNQIYRSNEGSLQSTQQVDDITYQIVAKIKVTDIQNADLTKALTCTATLKDDDGHVAVTQSRCQESGQDSSQETASEGQVEVAEPVVERRPIQLDNEVQSDTAITSGEQFIAIPRDQPRVPCFGCATHVNPHAAGVSDLANLGVRHLDIHQPTLKHTLDQVLDVERQVQVVNGVRYILTISVNFDNCTDTQSSNCVFSNICKITFLVKPWVKLSNGANYKAILGNNCTEEWQYGDNGEVLSESTDNRTHDKDEGNKGNDGSDIKVKHNSDVQSQPNVNVERTLTDEEIKNLEEQIIPNNQYQENYQPSFTISPDTPGVSKEHVYKVESSKRNENSIPVTEQTLNLNLDKKKAIDDLLNYFDFSGFKLETESADVKSRARRSYDYDLQLLSLTEDYHGIKSSIENARFIYGLAQTMVNYLNEIDMEVKNRAVKSVIKAEEETDSLQRYIYIQVSVIIPCDKVECEPSDSITQICNGVIDATNNVSPQILSSFCYNDNKERDYRDIVKEIPLDDPVLQNLVLEAVEKIESESKFENALKVNKIISAITQVTSGTLTKISIVVDSLKCNKKVPIALRINCTVLVQLGSKICEIIVHERHWLKEKKISYSCTERPVDMKISKEKSMTRNVNVEDPTINEMLQEAIQFLETQSENNYRQKIVNVTSISSQIIAGILTKIEFVVGYTNCTGSNELTDDTNKCHLLNGDNLRLCKAQFWDRSWIIDGRQVEVTCDDVKRKKRSVDVVEGQTNDNRNPEMKYKKLADESLNKFMQSSLNHQHYEVVKVDKVDVQHVPTELIKIQFSISPTNCILKNGILSPIGCHIINPNNVIQCRSKILENGWVDKNLVFVNCNLKDYRHHEKSSKLQERDPNDPNYSEQKSNYLEQNHKDANAMQIAVEALQAFLKNNPESLLLRVTFVDKVIKEDLTTKIVFLASHTEDDDGDTICYALLATNVPISDTEVKCHPIGLTFKRIKVTDEDPNYYKYVQLADESLYNYLRKINSSQLYTVDTIENVTVQWDEGVKTKITFIISPTDFENQEVQGKICLAEIQEQPWIHNKTIDVKCEIQRNLYRTKRQALHNENRSKNKNIVLGGLEEKDPNDLKYRVLAEESLAKFISESGTIQPLQVVRVEKVTTQVVAGKMTRIDFVISGSQDVNKCHSEIWEQAWINKKDIKVSCGNGDQRSKRETLAGGLTEQDPNDPKYRALAEESLVKFIAETGTIQPLQVVRVEKVTTQVVAGKMTRIDFVISGSQDVNKCHSEIWEQAWINKKDIKVSCGNGDQRSKRESMAGGLTEHDPNDPKYRALAEESLAKFIAESGTIQPLQVVRVEKVTTQVVAGKMTRIDFVISGSQDVNKCHSEIWEQAWINKKDIKVSCGNGDQRSKRESMAGGLTEQDPHDPKYRALAEESLAKFIAESGTIQPLQVVRVEKVTTQVVAGKMTRIDFVISGSQDVNKCHSEIWEQAWINKKDIKVSCGNGDQRSKRETLAGGLTEQDPQDPKYRALAEESLAKFIAETGTIQPLQVVRVEKVTTQVVAGKMTRIDFVISGSQDVNKCHSEIWEQAWINKKDIKVSCGNGDQRSKRETLAGGLTEQDPNDPTYRALAEESLAKFIAESGTIQPLQVVRVEKVTTQVVAGIMTRIDFVISGSQDVNRCHSEIWEQAWINKKDIKVSCGNGDQRSKRESMAGGLTEHDPNDPKYRALAEESLAKFIAESGTIQPLQVVRVEKVTTQVVAGKMTRIDFVISGSQDVNKCHSEIWEQAWINKKDIKVSCGNGDQRSKRETLAGGLTEQDPNDPTYRALAEESLAKFIAETGTIQPLQVVRVEKVTTQVVAGKMTRIDFVISGSQDVNKCHSEIWEQAWINKKDIKVSCGNGDQRSKRETLAGGLTEQDPNDPTYRALAEESLAKFIAESGTIQPLQVVRVEKVTTQVVAGKMTRIDFVISGSQDVNKCHSEIWEQAWINKKDIKVSCGNGDQRSKRETLAGGLTEQDPNDPTYRALAEESLAKFIAESGTIQPLQVVRVEKVTTQVVAGKMTRIDFVISGSQDVNKCHSEIWEQAWINKKDIKVSCGNGDQRSKRETLAGGLTEQDPQDPKYRALAEESLAKFIAETGTIQPLQVVRVEKVTTQVVAGKMTRIDFVISGSQDVNKCHSEIWEQAWINKKDIKVSCGNGDQRSKRETLAGGLTEQDPNDPTYRALAEESLAKFIAETGTIQPLQVVRVEKVTTQVVAGKITRIDFVISGSQDVNKCHSEIWEQAWINKKDIKVSCGNGDQRSKRESMAGGLTEQDPHDPKYRALAEESLAKFIAESGTIQPLQVVRVEKVTTQVVAGKMTRIDFVISGSQDVNKCHSEIWEQAWINKKDIKVSCGNGDQRSKRGTLAGGLTEQDPQDPKYRALAEESLAKFIAETGTIQPLQVVRVEKVTTQVVAGKMTRIDFVISGSQDVNKCHSEIWEQAWINKKDIKVSCGNGDQRSKRETLAGGLTEQDPNDPTYRALAEESLAKFIAESGTIQPLQVVRVEKVTTQVVAGIMTRIDFVISGSQDVNRCHSEIWEQAWINKKDIKVSCGNGDQRSKRESMAGGLTEHDPNDPKYRALAEESLAKFIAESGTIQPLQVVRVEKVTTQVVAGKITRIDFVISGSQDVNKCHSEIWEQAWINKKDIKVSCGNGDQRSKRETLAGGLTEQDPNDPTYRALAEESLAKFIAETGTIQPLQVVRVEKVTTQVVAGIMTRIDFVISGSQDVNRCHSEIWEQAWINKKDIKVSCGNGDQRSKRETLAGGLTEQDPNDPTYRALAEESLAKFIAESGTIQPLQVVRVEKVTTQVVAGKMTRIDFVISGSQDVNKCHSEIWEQAWINKKDIKVSCGNGDQRSKRESMAGGLTEHDPNDPKYRALAEESLAKFIAESGTIQPLQVVRVEKVTTQVVAGKMTRIDFVISGSQDVNRCHSEIWEQAWINKKDIKVSCGNGDQRSKRETLAGGLTEQDPNDPTYRALAEESLAKFIAESGTIQPLQVVRVEKVTTQVVAGKMTRIDFVISGSQDVNKCHSEIWEQAWINKKDIKVSCGNGDQRSKRETLAGGLTEQDPNDPTYRALAEESLAKFIAESGTIQPLQVVRVEKVTTQVVAGIMTRIDFVISGSQDVNKCHSEIWEQAWINKKDIKVSCGNGDQRSKRESMAGGLTEHDPNDPKYRALAEESLAKFIAESGTIQPLQVVRVEKVTTQVVAGKMTRIDFVISGSQDVNKCHSEIWEQAWINKKDIKVSCGNGDQRSKRETLAGGLEEKDPNDPKYRVLAEESLAKFIAETGTIQPLQVVRVEKVTTQVVAGKMTRIDFVISGSQDVNKCHSEIWEQAWINKKDIKVSCGNGDQRSKRELMAGGLTEQDPNDPKYRVLAEESLAKFIAESGTIQPLQVVRVEKVTTQVVAGKMTRIDFVISGSQDVNKCHSEIWEQAWINKKDIKVSCGNGDQRSKRDLLEGGLTEQDPNDPKYKTLAEESLAKFIAESGTTQPLQVVRVEKVTTQVVAGEMTRIDFVISGSQDVNKCHSEIWEQAWINKKDIKVSCGNGDQRSKRESMAGGLMEHDPNDPKYRALAEESLVKFIAESGTTQTLQVVRVEKVTTQVVAGTVTRIDFTVSALNVEALKCHSYIFEQVWLDKKEVDVDCIPINIRVRRDLGMPRGLIEQSLTKLKFNVPVGKISTTGNSIDQGLHNVRGNDEEEQNPNKPEYKLLAEESLRKFQQRTSVYHKVLEVKRVLTRVVSGLKYSIDFTAAPTACSVNESRVNARKCKTDDEIILYCHTEIWDRPWLRKKNIDVQCNDPSDDRDDFVEDDSDISDTLRPENVGNHSENHMKLAKEATEKYLTASNRKYVHKVTGIQSVNEQQSDGTHTTIDFTMSPTTCLRNVSNKDPCEVKQPIVVFNCNAKIRNKLWTTNESEIEVTCKKASAHNRIKNKRDVGIRNARQIVDDAEEMDEDIIYYYADRALQHVNDHSSSNNLHKLISIHAVQSSVQMGTLTVKMYIEIAETYCLRHQKSKDLKNCEELNGLNHRLCLARLWPSPDEELITRHISVVCDDEEDFVAITGVNVPELLRLSMNELEKSPGTKFKLVHQGEPQVIPSLDSREPFKINFIIAYTNCSKDVDLETNPFQCYINTEIPSKSCQSFIWLKTDVKYIQNINVKCSSLNRLRRSTNETNMVSENEEIKSMVAAALEKLEMSSLHRYKQRVLQINSHSTKITSGKVTTIDFDVGYTSCLKYEWVENITSCDFLEHLPRRRCVAQIWERLWIKNGQNIDVNCVDDETPLESHIEFESAEMANALAREALKHIEAKYPHPSKQKVVRIFSLEKQVVAGIHYKMKIEVGFTDCFALSDQTDCKLLKDHGLNKFCRVNVWVRPWTDHPPNFRVSCDFQEGTTHDLYHHVQAEQLFYNFLTMYSPSYVNDYSQMQKRFEIFKNNIKKIHELNVHEKGTAVYGVTRFTDLTYEEFSSTYMGLNTNLTNENQVPMKNADVPDIKIPEDFDWRDHDAVTEVKDQGSCGSCWAFSVTGNIEGQWKMQSGQLVSLSEQELVDCDKLDNGCNGGLPDNAYRAIEQMGGLELESDYPYEGVGDKCVFNKSLAKVQISGAVNITKNETGMAQWLVHNGPISIGINANAMQFYMGGISHPWKMLCDPTNLDHGVLIVGYGIKDYPLFHKKLPYWIIKNSWGKSWGEQGYYRVYRGDGTCGVNQMASSAII